MFDVDKDITDFIELDIKREEAISPGQVGFFHGLKKGMEAYGPNDVRTEMEQKAWDKYYSYKTPSAEALQKGLIDEEDFNFIKGKAGASTVVNHFVDRANHPDLNNYISRAINIPYQLIQTVMGEQSLWDAATDYWEQGIGSGDNTPLGTPEEEIAKAIERKRKR